MSETNLLYKKITAYLRDRIYNGDLKPGDRLPTEMELAKQFQVSRITSKRALEELKNSGLVYSIRGSGTYVSNALVPRKLTGLIDQRELYQQVVSLVIPFNYSAGGIMDTITGASEILKAAGYMVDVTCITKKDSDARDYLMQLYERGTAGVIYYPTSDRENFDLMSMLYLENYPLVVIDKYYEGIPLCSVVSDNRTGMYNVVQYLLDLGHQKIAFASNKAIEGASSIRDRYFGYASALKEHGITVCPDYTLNGTIKLDDPQHGKAFLRSLLDKGVTAICAVNDELAISIIRYLRQLDISVPEQISVTGFDDIRIRNLLERPLTTVRQDMTQIGRSAATTLLELMSGSTPAVRQKVIPTQLKIRESCAEPVNNV